MNTKTIVGAIIILVFIIFGAYSFLDTNVEYTDIAGAMAKGKKVQLKGTWNRERATAFNPTTGQFSFYLVDDNGKECQVILEGAAPNNFELATSVVAKGRFTKEGYFHATKCPSKYEATGTEVMKPQS
jgi:cytochrome c-type biogenesis protein CcmE